MSVPGDKPVRMWPHASDVTRDTPTVSVAKSLRPGNFKNVIRNILYPFAMSDPRCSVSSTDRPHDSKVGRGTEIRRCRFPDHRVRGPRDAWNFEGPRPAELERYAVPDQLPVRSQRSRTEHDRHRVHQARMRAVQR